MAPLCLALAAATLALGSAAAASLPALVSAAAASPPAAGAIPPRQDPWYWFNESAALAAAQPGQLLRVRVAPGNLTGLVANCSAAYNLLYRTTDSQYQPTWAVTTLLVPAAASAGHALLSYQIPYDSADVDASPSYELRGGVPGDVAAALDRGWFVVVPDYEGPRASFTAGIMSGHATLDGVRAAAAASFGLRPDARCALWGYSGGALASEWAAELAAHYAPELALAGAALGGLTPNITSVLETVDGTAAAGLVPAGMLGLASQHPDLWRLIDDQLKPDGPRNRTGFLAAAHYTLAEAIPAYYGHRIGDYFRDGLALLRAPAARRATGRDGVMGLHGVPRAPLYVYKAVGDEISPVADTDALVARLCAAGVAVRYVRNAAGDHEIEAANGRAGAEAWLARVLEGEGEGEGEDETGCVVRDVDVGGARARKRGLASLLG